MEDEHSDTNVIGVYAICYFILDMLIQFIFSRFYLDSIFQ